MNWFRFSTRFSTIVSTTALTTLTTLAIVTPSAIGTSRPAFASTGTAASTGMVQAQSVPASGSTYRDPRGLFEIFLPAGYTSQVLDTGVLYFQSADQNFTGVVMCAVMAGTPPSREQLEAIVKSTNAEFFSNVTWQSTQIQPNGTLVMPWVGRDPNGSNLDSIAYVEQRSNQLCMLNLSAIDRPYSDYSSDAQAILSSYRTSQP